MTTCAHKAKEWCKDCHKEKIAKAKRDFDRAIPAGGKKRGNEYE